MVIEQYATADDGTPLRWRVSSTASEAARPAVILLPGGGFRNLFGIPLIISSDLKEAGFIVFTMTEYRIAPPNKLSGQVSDGRWPDQTNDLELAAAAAAADSRCDGTVFAIGGSAGGSHAAYLASKSLVRAAVCFSPAMQLDDPVSLRNATFHSDVNNYAPDNLAEASPNNMFITDAQAPIFIVAFTQDNMPAPQYASGVDKLKSLTASYESQLLQGSGHSWDAWRVPGLPAHVASFLTSIAP